MDQFMSWMAEAFDLPILDWIAENIANPVLDAVMPVITVLGDAGIFWILCAVALLCFPKHRKTGLAMGAALIIGLLICNLTLKPLVERIRPYDYQAKYLGNEIKLLISRQSDFSFPSGHTIASFEAATVLMIRNKKLGVPALVLAILIAFSRLYLYVHYPTDVLVSVVLGVGIAFLGNFLVNKGFALWEKHKLAA